MVIEAVQNHTPIVADDRRALVQPVAYYHKREAQASQWDRLRYWGSRIRSRRRVRRLDLAKSHDGIGLVEASGGTGAGQFACLSASGWHSRRQSVCKMQGPFKADTSRRRCCERLPGAL